MIYIFYFFSLVLVYLSYRSFVGGIAYLGYFHDRMAAPPVNFTPFTTIVAPCRGLDPGMRENLEALIKQDFPDYEVIFVVDDASDEAVPLINEVSRQAADKTKLVIAPKASGCSQKVENLREAVLHVDPRSEVLVFVDSDVRPVETWLRDLVAPLEDESIGATTGYRWFISPKPTFSSELRSVWNASVASALGPNRSSNFTWGGSMAVRRETFERINMREEWNGTLSDDFAMTRTIKNAKLPIVFVPQALTASIEACTFAQMLEFTTRQMKVTRVYATPLWIMSFIGSGIFCGVLLAAFLIAILSPQNSFAVWFSLGTIVLVSAFSVGKSWLRLKAVRLVLTKYEGELRRQFWTQNTLWILAPAVFFYNCIAALVSRRMRWRGTVYELKSPHETVIIAD